VGVMSGGKSEKKGWNSSLGALKRVETAGTSWTALDAHSRLVRKP
jgi:hypothetical protein